MILLIIDHHAVMVVRGFGSGFGGSAGKIALKLDSLSRL